jgi:hypothetical protein
VSDNILDGMLSIDDMAEKATKKLFEEKVINSTK